MISRNFQDFFWAKKIMLYTPQWINEKLSGMQFFFRQIKYEFGSLIKTSISQTFCNVNVAAKFHIFYTMYALTIVKQKFHKLKYFAVRIEKYGKHDHIDLTEKRS